MIFAYALLGVAEYKEPARETLERTDHLVVPDSLRVELANVVWQWVARRGVAQQTGFAVLDDAEALIDEIIPSETIWRRALEISISANHPVYDTLFIAAAEQKESRVVTFDRRLQSRFPDHTISPASLTNR